MEGIIASVKPAVVDGRSEGNTSIVKSVTLDGRAHGKQASVKPGVMDGSAEGTPPHHHPVFGYIPVQFMQYMYQKWSRLPPVELGTFFEMS